MAVAFPVQGIANFGNSRLVAGKTTTLRVHGAAPEIDLVHRIEIQVLRPDGSSVWTTFAHDSLVFFPAQDTVFAAQSPSVVASVAGKLLVDVGHYEFRLKAYDVVGNLLDDIQSFNVRLNPTKDLRIMVSRIWSGTPTKPGEILAAYKAMERLAALYPIRDGVSRLDDDRTSGLRYNIDDNTPGPPHQDDVAPLWDKWLNRPAGVDSIDAAILYRFPNNSHLPPPFAAPDEPPPGAGANARPPYKGVLPFGVIVWDAPFAGPFCQETAHGFGLEPPDDPNRDPGGQGVHSKYQFIDKSDAATGFDLQFNQGFPDPTFDVMYAVGPSPGVPDGQLSFNAWDYAYLGEQLAKLSSTGPVEPDVRWSPLWESLGGEDLQSKPVVGKNQDGRLEVFIYGGNGQLYHQWQTTVDQWSGWAPLGGSDLHSRLAVVNNENGSLDVFVLGGNNAIYHRRQNGLNGIWDDWEPALGGSVIDFAVNCNRDGRLEIVAVLGDRALYHMRQLQPNGDWSRQWEPLLGHDLAGPVTLGKNADGRLEAFVLGGDGKPYHIWQKSPNGVDGWTDWTSLGDIGWNISDPDWIPRDIAVERAGDGRLYAFLVSRRGILHLSQIVKNGNWNLQWQGIWTISDGLQLPCKVGLNADGRLEVLAIGNDGQLYTSFQTNSPFEDRWLASTKLGDVRGMTSYPGIGVGTDQSGALNVFLVASDKQLYYFRRPMDVLSGIGGWDLRSPSDRMFAFDYDHSGSRDHLVAYRPGKGAIFILKNDGGQFTGVFTQGDSGSGIGGYNLKSPADRAFAFDYDGSGKLDHLALYRPGTGTIWILKNLGGVFSPVYHEGDPGNGIGGYNLKSPADRAFAFDYDGSGKLDHLVLYRPGTGTIWILKNMGGVFSPVYHEGDPGNGIGGYDLKSPADRAFAFDYDGSGNLDHLVLYRPGIGVMFILKNNSGTFSSVYEGNGIGGYDLKSPADQAFAFDYDHSRKLDHLVLYRPGIGVMFILKNNSGTFSSVYEGNGIGGWDLSSPSDRMFAFDYGHSGKRDHLVVYRPGKGAIRILRNSAGNFRANYQTDV